jgi:hypothetical protein
MLVSSIAFSQLATKNNTVDSFIVLPKIVAKEVVKDLIRKDSLESELNITKTNMGLLKNNIIAKDSIISSKNGIIELYKEKENNYNTMIDLKDSQKKNLEDLVKKLNKDLKKQRVKLATRTTFGVIVIGGLSYLLLK